ncbi:hypothetical protein B0H14DRAFT_2652713 [Mycena olivaceomarginata]|nr:hypothetical protein B0H14DRAFT_2652713 [Mycena olivaceomarginata]
MYFPFSTGDTPATIQVNLFATPVPNSIIHPLRCRYLALGEDPAGSYDDGSHPLSAIRRCAADLTLTMHEGQSMTVADYFQRTQNKPLQLPDVICAELDPAPSFDWNCVTCPGATHAQAGPPGEDEGRSIKNGSGVLAYGQSEYVRQFGMNVDNTAGPLMVQGPEAAYVEVRPRLSPSLHYPRDGAWNMVDKKFFKPVAIERWVVVVYERQGRFNDQAAQDMITAAMLGLNRPALHLLGERPGTHRGPVKVGGSCCCARDGQRTAVILPQGGNNIYTSVKHFEDITVWLFCFLSVPDERRHAMPQDEYFMLASFGLTNCASAFEMLPPQAAVLRERLPAVQPILGCVSHAHYLAGSTSSPAGLNNTSRDRARPVCSSTRTIGPLPFVIHPVLLLNHRQRWLGNGASADCFSPRHGCALTGLGSAEVAVLSERCSTSGGCGD